MNVFGIIPARPDMTNVLLVLALPEPVRMRYFDHLRQAFPQLRMDMVDHASKVDPYIGDAEVLISFGPMMEDQVFAKAKNLKWVQALGSGTDGFADQPSFCKDWLLTNMHGFHGSPVSEAALMSMLVLARDLRRSLRNQAQHRWERFPARLIAGKTVCILGVGAIAAELAPKCKALGMRVIGVSSSPRSVPGFDAMFQRRDLESVVGEVDYLVLLTPRTRETTNIVGVRVLSAMRPGACLVNLARGGVVDESALVDALRAGRLAGAALDVFAREPLPADSPFWDMDNVIVTQHQGGFFDDYPRFAIPVVEENLRKWVAGDVSGMVNVVKH
jgi:D-2-hydroxyacid dehydrogenase (NADP+)